MTLNDGCSSKTKQHMENSDKGIFSSATRESFHFSLLIKKNEVTYVHVSFPAAAAARLNHTWKTVTRESFQFQVEKLHPLESVS